MGSADLILNLLPILHCILFFAFCLFKNNFIMEVFNHIQKQRG